MADQQVAFSGTERASVLLLALGESIAAQVIRYFTPSEAEQVGSTMIGLKNLSMSQVDEVIDDFLCQADRHTALGMDSERFVRTIFTDALQGEKARMFLDRLVSPSNGKGIEALQWMDARTVAELVGAEHPQILAVILSCVENNHAARILKHLPESKQANVLMRISRLNGVRHSALEALDEVLVQQCSGSVAAKSTKVGGLKPATEILSRADPALAEAILEKVGVADAGLGRQLQELRFGLGCLLELDTKDMQILLKAVSPNVLSIALTGVDRPLREKILNNLPPRQAETLRAKSDGCVSVDTGAVARAREEILSAAHRLTQAGVIYSSQMAGTRG